MNSVESESPQYPDALPLGTTLGEFVITKVIGVGGFGIVYMARDTALERTVAIKEYLPITIAGRSTEDQSVLVRSTLHQLAYTTGLQSFLREARLQARFSHPAMLEVYRVWEQNATAYMAMRYYPGRSLRDLRHDDNASHLFQEDAIKPILLPVFDALEELHSQSVLHRDVSPDNILMLPTGSPVLLDFGSARTVVAGDEQSLTTVLKPGYAPLEQYADDGTMEQGPWTDVYGLGAVLHYLAIGTAPPQPVTRLLGGSLRAFADGAAGRYSQRFIDAVTAALAVKPKERLQSVAALRDALGWQPDETDVPATVTITAPAVVQAETAERVSSAPETPVAAPAVNGASNPKLAGPRTLVILSVLVLGFAAVAYWASIRGPVSDETSAPTKPPVATPVVPAPRDQPQEKPGKTPLDQGNRPATGSAAPTVEPAAAPISNASEPVAAQPQPPAPVAKAPDKRTPSKAVPSGPPAASPTAPKSRGTGEPRASSDTCERLFAKLSLGNAVLTETEQKLLPGCR